MASQRRRALPVPRNPVARALACNPSLRPCVVKAAKGKGSYTRKGRSPREQRRTGPLSYGGD